MKIHKKAILESTLGKVVLMLVVIIVIIGLVLLFTGRLHGIWEGFMKVFRFGG